MAVMKLPAQEPFQNDFASIFEEFVKKNLRRVSGSEQIAQKSDLSMTAVSLL